MLFYEPEKHCVCVIFLYTTCIVCAGPCAWIVPSVCFKGVREGKWVGGPWWRGGVDGGAAIISLKAIRILLFHYSSNHQEPPDEIFIRDLRIQAFLITIC